MAIITRICVLTAVASLGGLTTAPSVDAEPPQATESVSVTSDLVYGAAPDEQGHLETLRLDLYDPAEVTGTRPALVVVHGGGFSQGDKADPAYVATAQTFAEQGYVVASVNYRLRRDTYPDFPVASVEAQHDAQAAVRWLRANAVSLRIDPDRIGVTGHSAGAITALRVAAHSDDPGTSGTPGPSSDVAAVLAVSGFLAGEVTASDVPVLMLHGTADTLVPLSWARDTCRRWVATGGDCRMVEYAGGTHDATGFFDPASPEVADFLTCRLGGSVDYSDVAAGTPAAEALAWAEGRRISTGFADGAFRPSSAVTRAQFASWVWKALGRPSDASPTTFTDLAATTAVAPAASWAVSERVLLPRADGGFEPGRPMTRAAAAMALWRLANRPAGAPSTDLAGFDPAASYASAVSWLDDHGLSALFTGDTFRADAPLRRLQLVKLLRGLSFDESAWATLPGAPLCFGS